MYVVYFVIGIIIYILNLNLTLIGSTATPHFYRKCIFFFMTKHEAIEGDYILSMINEWNMNWWEMIYLMQRRNVLYFNLFLFYKIHCIILNVMSMTILDQYVFEIVAMFRVRNIFMFSIWFQHVLFSCFLSSQ